MEAPFMQFWKGSMCLCLSCDFIEPPARVHRKPINLAPGPSVLVHGLAGSPHLEVILIQMSSCCITDPNLLPECRIMHLSAWVPCGPLARIPELQKLKKNLTGHTETWKSYYVNYLHTLTSYCKGSNPKMNGPLTDCFPPFLVTARRWSQQILGLNSCCQSPFYQFHILLLKLIHLSRFFLGGGWTVGAKKNRSNRSWLTWPPQSLGVIALDHLYPVPLKKPSRRNGPAAPRPSDSQRSRWNRSDETWVFLMGPLMGPLMVKRTSGM